MADNMMNQDENLNESLPDVTEESYEQVTSPEMQKRLPKHSNVKGRQERRRLTRLLSLYERDRRLTAYDVHDGLAQQLAAAILHLQAFIDHNRLCSSEFARSLYVTLDLLHEALAEARGIMNGLVLPADHQAGLAGAIDAMVRRTVEKEGVQIDFVWGKWPTDLPAPIATTVYRTVQECLTNACRHSGSGTLRLRLGQRGSRLRICLRDYGRGFDPEQVTGERFGLRGIRERVRMFRGRVAIKSDPQRGTRITVELPLML